MIKRNFVAIGVGAAVLIGATIATTIIRKKKKEKEEKKEQGIDFVIENWW